MHISGHAAIVTGGASGLGEASARRLAASGAKVALFDLAEARGKQVASEIGGIFCHCDVTDEASVTAALNAAANSHGEARIAINCAGIALGQKTVNRKKDTGEITSHDMTSFMRTIHINLIGTFNVASKAAARMVTLPPIGEDKERGVIVMTASVAAEDGQIGQVAYAASKGGIVSLTLPMARDLSRDGVRVMTILPGLFHTPMFDSLAPDVRTALGASVPFPSRLGKPAEYAALVHSICENAMLNGSIIRLDGAIRLAPK